MIADRLTEDERALVAHVSRWGSDGYPVRRIGARWSWGPWRGINGPPVLFQRKRDAITAFEAYIDILLDKLAGRL